MRIVKPSTCRIFWERNTDAERPLRLWLKIVEREEWKSPASIKNTFGARADFVKVKSGNTVVVFDIANNNFRLIAAVHFNTRRLFVLRIMDHEEYDLDRWKEEL